LSGIPDKRIDTSVDPAGRSARATSLTYPTKGESGMDVKTFYQRIRDAEAKIPTPFVVMISLPTDDGGKKGVLVEVPRHLAAKMVVEGSAELAPADQAFTFGQEKEAAYRAAQDSAVAARVEVTMMPSDELKRLTEDVKKLKSNAKAGKD
jgi:hypothetical protein